MIICKLSDQLGNQMFAYASVKSIALDKGYDFKILGETLPLVALESCFFAYK